MAIRIKCKCGKWFLAKEGMVGKRAKCPVCKQKVTVPDPRKAFANNVVDDQMRQNAEPTRGPLSAVVNQVGRELDQLGVEINKLQSELAEVRRRINTA